MVVRLVTTFIPDARLELTENNVKQLPNVASVILVCTVESVKISDQDLIAPVPMATPESDVNTNTTLARQTLAKMGQPAPTIHLVLNVSVHLDLLANTAKKILLTAKRIHVHQVRLALI
jgi:hypothetical protein